MSADKVPHRPVTPEHTGTPRHVAIVMDGNGRWAQGRGLPRTLGHRAGVGSVRAVTEACVRQGVEALTLFAFSSENWRRPQAEVSVLMGLFLKVLGREVSRLDRHGIRLRIIGDRAAFAPGLQAKMAEAEARTERNTGLQLVIAASYGGRWDIAQAARALAGEVALGRLKPEEITEERFARQVCGADLPEPDLFIRTGGEQRISNFLLWQLAYTELFFTPVLWPDFRDEHLAEAFRTYAQRQRRFGQTPEQVERIDGA